VQLLQYMLDFRWLDATNNDVEEQFRLHPTSDFILCFHVMPERGVVLTGSSQGNITEWSLQTGGLLRSVSLSRENLQQSDTDRSYVRVGQQIWTLEPMAGYALRPSDSVRPTL
jgi:hypothetical protein